MIIDYAFKNIFTSFNAPFIGILLSYTLYQDLFNNNIIWPFKISFSI